MTTATRYWYDSFPGFDFGSLAHPIVDFYGTPYGGPEDAQHTWPGRRSWAHDGLTDWENAPYTTVSQNRGGPS